jgi:hypothetical protein
MVRHQPAPGEPIHDEALHLGFAVCLAVAHSAGDLRKRRVDDLAHGARRATVTRELRGAPNRLEALDEIGR